MPSPSKTVLVTGGAGYIGSHAAKMLAKSGYEPVVYDNLTRGHEWAVRWGPLVVGDIGDADLLAHTIKHHNIGAILHFAALAYVGESVTNPELYFENNVVKSLTLLKTAWQAGVKHIVFSSTCATYGSPEILPITERERQRPINPYGETKLCVERALHWYDMAHGTTSVALRYFNAAGGDLDGEIGEAHSPETHLIPLVFDAAQGGKPIAIFGTDYDTPDGTCIRDYIHVTDLADAHVKALHYLREDGPSTALNLGTGQGYSVKEILASVEAVTGRPVPHRIAERRPGDPPSLVADPSLANETLRWKPECSDIETIVRSGWHWHRAVDKLRIIYSKNGTRRCINISNFPSRR